MSRDFADRPRLLFIATEDWFFASHFLPMVRAAREMDLSVTVIARGGVYGRVIAGVGAEFVDLPAERRDWGPRALYRQEAALRARIAALAPDIVHCIALRSILLGGFATKRLGIRNVVFAVTGLGFLGARRDPIASAARQGLGLALRGPLAGPGTRYLFENPDDPVTLGLMPAFANRVMVIGGAGVDPLLFLPAPLPPAPPLRVALVSRMLWSKGVDLAVAAVRKAQAAGARLQLTLVGAPDPSNPKAIPQAELEAWGRLPGIRWIGAQRDIAGVWAAHHLCCLPSRGGEGLPRALLEAAACGRALLTTDVPGCRSFVRDGIDGRVVVPDDVAALAEALEQLARAPGLVERMGVSARARVLDGYTERDVMSDVKELWRGMLDRPGG